MTNELSQRPSTGLRRLFDRDPFQKLQQQMDDLISSFSREWDGGHWLTLNKRVAPFVSPSHRPGKPEGRRDGETNGAKGHCFGEGTR